MARPCSICSHPRVLGIDAALLKGGAYRTVAKEFEASESSVYRHWKEHLPLPSRSTLEPCGAVGVMESRPAARSHAGQHGTIGPSEVRGVDLFDVMARLQACTLGILATASAQGRYETALKAIRETRGNVELIAKLEAELGGGVLDPRRFTADNLRVLLRESLGQLSGRDRHDLLLDEPELADLVADQS